MVTQLRLTLATMFACILIAGSAMGQTRTVTGVVASADDGTPLPGASVALVGTQLGTATDVDGRYSIDVPQEGARLRFSFIGYVTQEIPVGNRVILNVELAPDFRELDELVVVGYGEQLQRTLTGNISRVSARDIENEQVLSIEQAMQGRMAGVQIQANNGKLGQGIQVRVRGSSSVSASNQPLYVIDGIPVTTTNLSGNGAATNPMADINPNDIESIEVLKDASAAAIYGARGSNGVVLITTRRGHSGQTRFSASLQRGWSEPTRLVDLLNGEQYVELMLEGARNTAELWDWPGAVSWVTTRFDLYSQGANWNPENGAVANFDWQREAFQSAGSTNFELSAQGGDRRTRFFLSGGFEDANGILIQDEFNRLNGRVNLEHDLSARFQMGGRLSLVRTLNKRLSTDNAFATPMQLIAQPPIQPIFARATGAPEGPYVAGERYNPSTLYFNGLLYKDNVRYNTTVLRSLGSAFASYRVLEGLTFRSEFGVDLLDQHEDGHWNSQVARSTGAAEGVGMSNRDRIINWTANNYFTFVPTLGVDHVVDLTLGTSFQSVDHDWTYVEAERFPSDAFTQIQSASEVTIWNGGITSHTFLSYFARTNYALFDRYLMTLSGRVDGSSRFGTNNRYGFFPAASVGWILSDEAFMANMPFDLFKLRASYGLTGNAEIGNFLHRGQWGASRYDGMPGTRPIQTENPDLRWERTGQFNAGLDLSLLGDRVSAQVDYYLKQTTDLLLNVNVPGTTGFTLETRNVGSLRNEGVEFVINTRNLTGNFGWTSNFVFGTNRNRITDLDGQVIEGGFINRAIEGHPIGVFFGLEYAGVDPDNGDALYYINERDENGNIINAGATTWNPNLANRVVLGSPHPDFTGGFGNNFTYGNFSLSALLQFSYGNQIYDGGGRFKSANGDFLDNQSADQMRRWRQPGDITDVPQARLFDENGTTHSSRYLYDGSYLRLKNVAVSYQIPRGLLQQAQLQSARIFVAGQNLLTWTRYPWWDPEVNTDFLAGNIGLGNEFYSAPQARTITTGIQVNF
jgi:TonB-dependent starch-binding outer membrane protein SusC